VEPLVSPLESSGGKGKKGRSITSPIERFRLMLDSSEEGSVASIVRRAGRNADSLREAISPEAWSALALLRGQFARSRYRSEMSDYEARRTTRRLSDMAVAVISQFFVSFT